MMFSLDKVIWFWVLQSCPVGLPSSANRCWQVLLQVGYHSAEARLIKRVVCMSEDSWAQQALAFKLVDTVLDLTGSVDGK